MNASLFSKLLIMPFVFPMAYLILSKFFIPITILFNLSAGHESMLQENIYLGSIKFIYCLVGSLWISRWLWRELGDTSKTLKEA